MTNDWNRVMGYWNPDRYLEVYEPQEGDEMENEMTGSEALYGFMAWLTTRDSEVTFSAHHDAALAAELVDEFCKVNNLAEPREDWPDRLTHPSESGPPRSTTAQLRTAPID